VLLIITCTAEGLESPDWGF